jgi:hypothetical protein
MSSPEALPLPDENSEEESSVTELNFGPQEVPLNLQAEDLILQGMLEGSNREFIFKLATRHGVHPFDVLDTVIESYRNMHQLIEDGGVLYVKGKDQLMRQIFTDNSETPPAV